MSSSSASGSPDTHGNTLLQLHNLPQNLSLAIPTTAATTPGGSIPPLLPPFGGAAPTSTTTTTTTTTYPNYYDYSENILPTPAEDAATKNRNMASMAMQVPIQPQQPPQQRLVDAKGPQGITTAQVAHAPRGAAQIVNGNGNGQRGGPPRDRPPSYSGSSHNNTTPNPNNHNNSSLDDIILPPNKVDLDAARYRRAQQQESRRERERDRDRPSKERKPSLTNGRPSSSSAAMGPTSQQHRGGNPNGRPLSPESPLLTPTGPNIQRLPTPSIPNSVLQPLDAKVVEYGTLMAEAQGEMSRLDEEMRALQDRQREAEQRFLDAKSKHDDYRRQYSDVERALRGDFARAMNNGGGVGMGQHGRGGMDGDDDVPPMPSMPSLQQYGTNTGGPTSRQGSGNLLNGAAAGGAAGPMPPRRTVSIQSDMVSQDSVRSHSHPKRGRFSRLFGV